MRTICDDLIETERRSVQMKVKRLKRDGEALRLEALGSLDVIDKMSLRKTQIVT